MIQKILSSIQKAWSSTNGFSLVEVMLAASIFALVMTSLVGTMLYGQESTVLAGKRARAVMLASEGIEATRNIKDEAFGNLSIGDSGIAIASNQWALSGASDTEDIFTRVVSVSSVDDDRKQVTSTVTWDQNLQRTGTVSLVTYFTNWEDSQEASCLIINTSGANIGGGGKKELKGLTIENTCDSDITISAITPTWDNAQLIEEIKIDGSRVWKHNNEGSPDGRQASGVEIDIVDFVLSAGTTYDIDKFKFNGNMTGTTHSITFTMSDNSTKEVAGVSL